MKRKVYAAILILTITVVSVVVLASEWQVPRKADDGQNVVPTESPSGTHVHGKIIVPTDYPTIKQAVENAVDGDTVFVKEGTYQENNITINKDISIVGENRDTTIIISQSSEALPLMIVNQAQVTITGFTMMANYYTAIKMQLSNGCNISGNKIVSSGTAILLDSSSNNTIENNIIRGNSYGVELRDSLYAPGAYQWLGNSTVPTYNNIIGANDIGNSTIGIYFNGGIYNNIVRANNITECGKGILVSVGYNNSNFVVGNYIAYNNYATYFYGGDSSVFHHNNFVHNSYSINVWVEQIVPQPVSIWDDDKEGNYWSNYVPAYQNGVVLPYQIDGFNRDNHPLTTMVDINNYLSYSSTTTPYPNPTSPSNLTFPSA